jgi:hypothetical protein
MLRVPTWLLSFFGLIFGLYHAVLGIIWINHNDRAEIVIAALLAYVAILIATIWVGESRAMPLWAAWLGLIVCALIPIAINSQLDASHLGDYATWYVLGVGTILGGLAVRGRRVLAWVGLAVLVLEIAAWGGVGSLASTGLPGVVSLIVTGHAVSLGVERAVKSAQELNRLAAVSAAETAAVEAAGAVRSKLLDKTLRTALPALNLIAALGGNLTDSQKSEALLLEAALRDEIRGEALLNDAMRAAIKAARERGVEVLVLDEGGLDGLEPEEREQLLNRASASFANVSAGRLTVRSPRGEDWRVTVAAVRPGTAAPDLWLKPVSYTHLTLPTK